MTFKMLFRTNLVICLVGAAMLGSRAYLWSWGTVLFGAWHAMPVLLVLPALLVARTMHFQWACLVTLALSITAGVALSAGAESGRDSFFPLASAIMPVLHLIGTLIVLLIAFAVAAVMARRRSVSTG